LFLGERQLTTEFSQWDISPIDWHYIINQERISITLGLVYSFGSTDKHIRDNRFNDVEVNNPLTGTSKITEAKYFNLGLLFGYSFLFKKIQL
jgi:hypothetical protein